MYVPLSQYSFVLLTALGLSYGLGTLCCSTQPPVVCGLQGAQPAVVAAVGLGAPRLVGPSFPDQGSDPGPLHHKADS